MDGGRDFDAEAARLGPNGLELLTHGVAELRKPRSPHLWGDELEIEEDRAETERAIAAGFKLYRNAVFLTTMQAEGKQEACDLIPPVKRGKAEKTRPERVERERLIVDLWRQMQRPKLSVEENYDNMKGRFDWYRTHIFLSQQHYQVAPPRGDNGWDDLFWRILKQVNAPMVSLRTVYKYMARSANNL